ncbi:MAG: HNH endonuclease family protein [Actinomycetaceae bacterium]|nr:HNH endonuclease family protein [Arcanobacterium sp.]MDD7686831.1 HNH endonuclease family protein [Actinomycetaceae bacterium]MDY5273586.1 HNH endonuclease family protein [Arcanobacterium sp.]
MSKKTLAGITAGTLCLIVAIAALTHDPAHTFIYHLWNGDQSPSSLAVTQADTPSESSAVTALAALPIKGRAPKTGYERESMFGKAWKDTDHNGCDTRNDILKRDLTHKSYREGTHGCVVISGVLDDPYSGERIHFTRGQGTSELVQIDHVVALSDAWQKGAQQLNQSQREQLANDPLNLLAVDGALNQKKSDADAATWLPPNKTYRCEYVSRQIAVKKKYHLWVTETERDAMLTVLHGCTNPTLPADFS